MQVLADKVRHNVEMIERIEREKQAREEGALNGLPLALNEDGTSLEIENAGYNAGSADDAMPLESSKEKVAGAGFSFSMKGLYSLLGGEANDDGEVDASFRITEVLKVALGEIKSKDELDGDVKDKVKLVWYLAAYSKLADISYFVTTHRVFSNLMTLVIVVAGLNVGK